MRRGGTCGSTSPTYPAQLARELSLLVFSLMGVAPPTATGDLASTPFCELLVYALTKRLSGSLVLETTDHAKHAVLLAGGQAVKARVSSTETRIGDVLATRGYVDAAACRAAVAAPGNELFGARLVAQGALDSEALERGLGEQLLLQLAWLSRLPDDTQFGYYDGIDYLSGWGGEPLRVDPLAAVWRCIEAGAPPDRVSKIVEASRGTTLRLHPGSRVARFAFPSPQRAALDVLRVRPQSLEELEATGLAEANAIHRLVYALVITRHLDVGGDPLGVPPGRAGGATRRARPVASPRAAAAQARSTKGPRRAPAATSNAGVPRGASALAARATAVAEPESKPEESGEARASRLSEDEIQSKLESLEGATHYEVLGVPTDAPSVQVASAFSSLARNWHPDRLRPEQHQLRARVTQIFVRMTEANQVLGHADSRQHYDQTLSRDATDDHEQEQVARVLRAAEAFQKAEILVRKRDLAGAEQLAKMAFEGDESQPEYGALYAYVRSLREGCDDTERLQLLSMLRKALERHPQNVRIRYYYACVLGAAGDERRAMRELRIVVQEDPSNLVAARELRLHDMRQRSSASEAGGGLLGRIFRR